MKLRWRLWQKKKTFYANVRKKEDTSAFRFSSLILLGNFSLFLRNTWWFSYAHVWIFPAISVVDLLYRTDFDVDSLVLQVEIHFIGDEDGIHDEIQHQKKKCPICFQQPACKLNQHVISNHLPWFAYPWDACLECQAGRIQVSPLEGALTLQEGHQHTILLIFFF